MHIIATEAVSIYLLDEQARSAVCVCVNGSYDS